MYVPAYVLFFLRVAPLSGRGCFGVGTCVGVVFCIFFADPSGLEKICVEFGSMIRNELHGRVWIVMSTYVVGSFSGRSDESIPRMMCLVRDWGLDCGEHRERRDLWQDLPCRGRGSRHTDLGRGGGVDLCILVTWTLSLDGYVLKVRPSVVF